ncbi:MAG TPA: 30S ribosome-binding factor RbfA [Pyrinomonadaceae bacterium]|jgi:ribosome-binding factor A|nr:30S ribosome-binding factor RbfA [Pyrinomonadaceae bacterium]
MRRPEKVAENVREEIAQIVGYELDDPRVTIVTVTDVRMSDNLREARVFVMLSGTDDEALAALKALRKAAPYVRRQLAFNLNLRHAPEIHFIRDTVEEKAARVDELLRELVPAADAPQPDAADSGTDAETEEEKANDEV